MWRIQTTCLYLVATSFLISTTIVEALATSLFMEVLPLKASLLTKNWQGLSMEVDQKVGNIPNPDGTGGTVVGLKRFGPELERRTRCARQFERCYEATFAMAMADKTADASAKIRGAIPLLLIDGQARGPRCKTFASLTPPAAIAVVDIENDGDTTSWSVLMLLVNPTERDEDIIVGAERTMLKELCSLMSSKSTSGGKAILRVLDKAQETLAGDAEALGLAPLDAEESSAPVWYRCDL